MNDKKLNKSRQELREAMKALGYGWIDGKYIEPPSDFQTYDKVLNCISMINSILAYHWHGQSAEEVMQMEERAYYNYLADYVELFGRDKVVGLIQGQIDDIDYIKHNVHTDSEGVTYNSIIWKEN